MAQLSPVRMRVLHVIPSVSPQRGGPSRALQLMVQGLAGAGVLVDVATTDDDGPGRWSHAKRPELAAPGYHCFPRQTRFYTMSWPLRTWLRETARTYDLIHVHALFSFASTVAASAARRARVPYIVRPLGTLAPYGLRQRAVLKAISYRLIEERILRHAAVLHCTSQPEAAEIRALGVHTNIAVIPLGIDTAQTAPPPGDWLAQRAPQLAGRRVLLFLSRIDRKKGLELLLPAFANLCRSAPQSSALIIAGSGADEYVRQLQRQSRALGIERDVLWAGHLEGQDKAAALAGAHVFVLPSQAENFGLAVVEALAAGLPVVISREVGIHHEVTAGAAGLAVERTEAALTAALTQLLTDQQLRAGMATRARQLAESHFSGKAMTDQLLGLYRSLRT